MKKILFAIGSANISGGTNVIFEHALFLQSMGYSITIGCMNFSEYETLKESNVYWHRGVQDLNFISLDAVDLNNFSFDLAIFTWWRTVYYLPKINAKYFSYFVQSIESRFYDKSDQPLIKLVNNTYRIKLPVITEATWIKKYLFEHYNSQVYLVKNGIDKKIFTTEGAVLDSAPDKKLRVLIEGPLNVPFKNTERTIELCYKVKDIELWLLTSSKVNKVKNVDNVFSNVPIEKTAEIYRSCDVIVKLSYVEGMFGPPLEMFHCGGTCIVYDVTGHDEYIMHGYNGLVAPTDDENCVINYIKLLRDSHDYLKKLKRHALITAQKWHSWKDSSAAFQEAIREAVTNIKMPVSHEVYSKRTEKYFQNYIMEVEMQPMNYRVKYKIRKLLALCVKKNRLLFFLKRALNSLLFQLGQIKKNMVKND